MIKPGENLDLTLYWRSTKPIEQSYTVFTHILDNEGQLLAQQDNLPENGKYLTSWWMAGEIITDLYSISIPEHMQAQSDASLVVGLYDLSSGERLLVDQSCPTASPHNFLTLSKIEILSDP
jgi:hypothetical protein